MFSFIEQQRNEGTKFCRLCCLVAWLFKRGIGGADFGLLILTANHANHAKGWTTRPIGFGSIPRVEWPSLGKIASPNDTVSAPWRRALLLNAGLKSADCADCRRKEVRAMSAKVAKENTSPPLRTSRDIICAISQICGRSINQNKHRRVLRRLHHLFK